MHFRNRKINLIGLSALVILLAAIIMVGIMYIQNSIYTSNLSSRPFNIGLTSSLASLDPALIENHGQRLAAAAIYEGLVAYDESTKSIQPRLAKNWKYENDGKNLIIHLRKDVKFSNGKKLTANDVKASWEYNFTNAHDWANISLYLSIAGSSAKLAGKSSEITGIKVLNQHTLQVTLLKPNAAFLSSLTNPAFWVLDLGEALNPAPGTGPYFIKEKQTESLVLLKNDHYYRGQPHLSAIIVTVFSDAEQALKAYQAGKIDLLMIFPL